MKQALRSILSLFAFVCCALPVHEVKAAEKSGNQVEVLRGDKALAHLNNLKARRSSAFALAVKLMEERGFKPTNIVTVVRSTRLVRQPTSGVRPEMHRVQTSVSNDSGEVVFWSWDDGNSATWEGVVYFEDYTTGANFTGNAQIDISQGDTESIVWEQQVSYTSGGGGSIDKKYTSLRPFSKDQEIVQVASTSPDLIASISSRPPIYLTQTAARVANFLMCFSSRCYVHMMQCRWTGPGWSDCSAALCGIDAIMCGIAALK